MKKLVRYKFSKNVYACCAVIGSVMFSSSILFGQGKLVFNGDVDIVIENQAHVVLSNPDANAIVNTAGLGTVLTKTELDRLDWKIGSSLGLYIVPFRSLAGESLPLQVNIDSPGDAAGNLSFSTYGTTVLNAPYPAAVANLNYMAGPLFGQDGSLTTVDRFWIIDNSSYVSKPSVDLMFTYSQNEVGGSNVIDESTLKAQRYNTGSSAPLMGGWGGIMFGNSNDLLNTVTVDNLPVSEFFGIWTLNSSIVALSDYESDFKATNESCNVLLSWNITNLNKIVNAFIVEESFDGVNWSLLSGLMDVNDNERFSLLDNDVNGQLNYYRLSSISENGDKEVLSTISYLNECAQDILIYPNPFSTDIIIKVQQSGDYQVFDAFGMVQKRGVLDFGDNSIDLSSLSKGAYICMVTNANGEVYYEKIIKN